MPKHRLTKSYDIRIGNIPHAQVHTQTLGMWEACVNALPCAHRHLDREKAG